MIYTVIAVQDTRSLKHEYLHLTASVYKVSAESEVDVRFGSVIFRKVRGRVELVLRFHLLICAVG